MQRAFFPPMHDPFFDSAPVAATSLAPSAPSARCRPDDDTLPERAPAGRETSRVGRHEVVLALLGAVRRTLASTRDGKPRRMLLRKLESLQFVVDCWGAIPPRAEQISAMLETLLKLQEAAVEARALSL
jgi:hypothetical protein